jgi:hypothetical protein
MGQRTDCNLFGLHGVHHLNDDIVSSAAFSPNWLHPCGGFLPTTTSRGHIHGYFFQMKVHLRLESSCFNINSIHEEHTGRLRQH